MSRPPGPPPYTAEEIASLDTPTARFIAKAELNSYIMGHKLADLREQGLLGAPTHTLTNSNGAVAAAQYDSSPLISDGSPDADSNHDNHSTSSGHAVGPVRGRPRKHTGKRVYRAYEPYPSRYAERASGWDDVDTRTTRITNTAALCPNFTSTGKCARTRCSDVHDVNKLALCKRFLYRDDCAEGAFCSLSHQPTPNNTPHCLYFLDDRCKKSPCMFLHVHADKSAPVCNSFGRIGHCDEGEICPYLHVYECPDFANKGICTARQCPLKHVHHASRMKVAARDSSAGTSRSSVDTVDVGDEQDGLSSPSETQNHAITQQHDYVAFDTQE